ncbi:MAG TPA: YfcE family phosphodiesterase, partial [Bacteroides uniformis]|nr:YfcE family phosphodiesterase [Bacteroides uniformis]
MCQCANEEKFADGAQPISILAHYHISILISFPNIIIFVLINKG